LQNGTHPGTSTITTITYLFTLLTKRSAGLPPFAKYPNLIHITTTITITITIRSWRRPWSWDAQNRYPKTP
jgi:hypothetical protein